MQKFLLANTVLLFGLSLSLVYSILLFGASNTVDSLNVLVGRTISVFLPSDVFAHNTSFIDISRDDSTSKIIGDFRIPFPQSFSAEELKYPMIAVSYTHLDVYKRQGYTCSPHCN